MSVTKFAFGSLLLFAVLLFTGCEPDDPDPDNPEELITTVTLTLIPVSGGETVALGFQDLDGDGGNAPTITGGTLQANTVYNGQITFMNLANGANEDITIEVVEEGVEHQVFYQFSGIAMTASYDDEDDLGRPIGVATTFTTSDAGTGTLTATLRHEPSKDAANVVEGNITNAGGETDVEVVFPVVIQ